MTEITEHKLSPTVERFVLQWGDLGGQWGVNRSVSQIQALLYLADGPMNAEDIAQCLGMARSNVSSSLKELLAWNLVRRVPMRADRRDHYEAETDLWEIVSRIVSGRKAREIDPAVSALRACVEQAKTDLDVSPVARKRLAEMLSFTAQVNRFYEQMTALSRNKLNGILKLGAKISALLPEGKD